MSSVDLPAGVLNANAAPPADREPIVRQEFAVSLYRAEYRSVGKARDLAGRLTAGFRWLLGEREGERHEAAADLALDIEYAREWRSSRRRRSC